MLSKLSIFTLLSSLVLSYNVALAQATCTLPVCSIDQKIAELAKVDASTRFKFLTDLKAKYKSSQKTDELENIRDFTKKSKALSIKLKDEDWLVNESDVISNIANRGLIVSRRPIEKVYMFNAFKELTTQDARFDILQYWNKYVSTLNTSAELTNMADFADLAVQHTQNLKDDDWVTNEALQVMNKASALLTSVDPYHEGIYKITLECSKTAPNCRQSYPDLNIMTIVEGSERSGYGLIVSFIQPAPIEPAFFFPNSNFTSGKGLIFGFSNFNTPSFPKPAEFSINLNRTTGEVSGHIIDTRSEGYILVKGTAIRRVIDLVTLNALSPINVDPSEIAGVYNAKFAGRDGRFIIKETSEANYIASFVSTKDNYSLDFKVGYFAKGQGLLNLVTFNDDLSFTKLILRFTKLNGKIQANGFHVLTSNGTSEDWAVEKKGNVINP